MNQAPELIRVVCRREGHDDELIDEMQHHDGQWDGTAGRLYLDPARFRQTWPQEPATETPAPPAAPWEPERATARHLDADDRVAVGDGGPDDLLGVMLTWPAPDAVRTRYRFLCPQCRLTVQARAEHLLPILDTLLEHGVPEVSLEALRVRVDLLAHRTRRPRDEL